MRKDDQISFKIQHAVKEQFKVAAKLDGQSVAQWLTDLGIKRVQEQEK